MMHLFLPKTASTFPSLDGCTGAFRRGPRLSSSWATIEIGCSNVFLLYDGIMLWNTDEGGGGLGVQVRETGLVKPPSLVSSALVMLLLLQVEIVDMPRMGLVSECSSVGEPAFEPVCSAVVKSDCWRSQRGFDFVKDAVGKGCKTNAVGRGVREGSGGSSRSATMSSSAVATGGAVFGTFSMLPVSNAPRLLT